MNEAVTNLYALAKDFAGPIATVVAASAAAFVTFNIQRQNHKVAQARLQLDLYNYRYAIYSATRDLLLLRIQPPDMSEEQQEKLSLAYYTKINEAPFSCGATAQAFCLEARAADNAFLLAVAQAEMAHLFPPGPEQFAAAVGPGNVRGQMLALLERIIAAFSEDLRVGPRRQRRWLPAGRPRT